MTTHPDVVIDLLDVDATAPLHPAPLGRYVAARRVAERDQPLGYRGVQAAGHRIFPKRVLRGESADLEGGIGPGRIGADDADLGELADGGSGRFECEHGVRVGEQQRDPPWPVVCPLGINDVIGIQPESVRDKPDIRFAKTVASDQRRRGKGESTGGLADANQTRGALLHDLPVCRGTPPASSQARAEPRVGCPAKGSSSTGVKMRTR